jgi:hypothetical protein
MNTVLARAAIIALALAAATGGAATVQSTPGYSATNLYNQGNAYARAGQPGMAVLHYERAQLLAPGDRDIETNLEYVREAQHLPLAPRPWYQRLALLQSPIMAALTGMLGLLLLGVSAVAGRLLTPNRVVRGAAAAAGIALMAMTLCQGALLWPTLHAGVVIAHEASVLESPVPMGEALFVLPEAETVTVTAEHEQFILIKTRAGRVGWVAAASLARVVP